MSGVNGNTQSTPRRVSTRELAKPAGEVEIMGYDPETKTQTDWRWVTVQQVDGYTYAAVKELQKMEQDGTEPDTSVLYDTVKLLIPAANEVEVMKLNAVQCGRILAMALEGVNQIEDFAVKVAEKNVPEPVDHADPPALKTTSSRPASPRKTR